MKLKLIIPLKNRDRKERDIFDFKFSSAFLGHTKGLWGVPLAAPTIAGLTPKDVDISIIDENIEDVDFDEPVDLVGITCMTLQATRAYEIATEYRKRGVKIVIGGVHPTLLPDEAGKYVDCVVLGEVEDIWKNIIEDFKAGDLKKVYEAKEKPDISNTPFPRRDLLKNEKYLSNLVQASRGCPFDCDFCTVRKFLGGKMRMKTVDHVVAEIVDMYENYVHNPNLKQLFITDDNIVGVPKYSRDFFNALVPINEKYNISGWTCQASVTVINNEENLELMSKAGCRKVFIGFESLTPEGLSDHAKGGVNKVEEYGKVISRIRDYDMDVVGSFILGSDSDDLSCFKRLRDFIEENNLILNLINILVPFPGTRLYERLEKEGRILTKDWRKYDMKHVVFKPKKMTPDELLDGFIWVNQEIYSLKAIYKKIVETTKVGKGLNILPLKWRVILTARFMSFLFSDGMKRTRFILDILPFILLSKYDVKVGRIINGLDSNDFACKLPRRKTRVDFSKY